MGSLNGLSDALSSFRQLTLDTSAWIPYFAGEHRNHAASKMIIDRVLARKCQVELPGIVHMELLVGPMKSNHREQLIAIRTVTERMPGVVRSEVTQEVLYAAASVRASTGFKAPDALVIASAAIHGSGAIVGSDARFRMLERPENFSVMMATGRPLRLPRYINLDDYL